MVKMVEAELKIEVSEDISAANITANIKPRKTEKKSQNGNWQDYRAEQPNWEFLRISHLTKSNISNIQSCSNG